MRISPSIELETFRTLSNMLLLFDYVHVVDASTLKTKKLEKNPSVKE